MTGSFIQELMRRKVFRVAAAYLVVAWLLLQVVATVAPILELPNWISRVALVFLALGFPASVVLAWAFELTPEGIKRDAAQNRSAPVGRHKVEFLIIGVLSFTVIYFAADKFVLSGSEQTTNTQIGKSVAVLVFDNLSGDTANDPFTLGIHDDLLTSISRIGSIKTISRTSVLQYQGTTKTIPEIALELGVATILEGGIQRSGNRVRINAQLIDASTDQHLWAETYDRELTAGNIFAIQSEIATAIANELRATLTEDEQRRLVKVPTQNIAALETYFIGKRMLEDRTKESLRAAVEYFETVVDLDPDFALAYSGLADAYMLLPEYWANADRAEIAEKSAAAVARALQLDPELPEVLNSQAWSRLIHDYDWQGAEELFRQALAIHPNNTNVLHWLSHTLSWQGRYDEALKLARHAKSVDPHSKLMHLNLVYIMTDARQYDAALELSSELETLEPRYFALRRNLYYHELRAGYVEDAAKSFRSWAEATGADLTAAQEVGQMFIDYKRKGTVGDLSQDLIDRLMLGDEDLGQVFAYIGDRERTLDALDKAAEDRTGSRSVLSMKINPAYDFVRDEAQFVALMKKIGLEE